MRSRTLRRAAARAAAKEARRAEINRQNAQHSTGPKTAEGKAKSSRNSFKHGLYSQQLCRTPEEAAALDALKADLRAEYQPGTTTEELLVHEMAEQYWRLKRARRNEAALLDEGCHMAHLAACQRMMSSAERGFHKALSTLCKLQAERGFVPQTLEKAEEAEQPQHVPEPEPQSGFVSQNESEVSFETDPFVETSHFCPPEFPDMPPGIVALMERHAEESGFVPQFLKPSPAHHFSEPQTATAETEPAA